MMLSYLAATTEIAWRAEDQTGTTVTAETVSIVIILFISKPNLIFCFRVASSTNQLIFSYL